MEMKWVCRDFVFVESENERTRVSSKETRDRKGEKEEETFPVGFDCRYEMIQTVKRKEDKR